MAKFRKPFDPKVLDVTPRETGGPVAGLTVRDWFAGKALANAKGSPAQRAAFAGEVADAMMAERKGEGR